MLGMRLHKDSASLSDRYLLTLNLEDAGALEHDVELVILMRLLAVGLWSDEHIDANFEAGGLVDDLIASAGLTKPFFDGCDLKRVHRVNLLHVHCQVHYVVLASRLHRPRPAIVLPRPGREAVDALLPQRHCR